MHVSLGSTYYTALYRSDVISGHLKRGCSRVERRERDARERNGSLGARGLWAEWMWVCLPAADVTQWVGLLVRVLGEPPDWQ